MPKKTAGKLAQAARTLGGSGGVSKGGHARAKTLTKAQRSEIARKGGKAKAAKKGK